MQREEVHMGLLVRLLSEYSNVPSGTWATVDSTAATNDDSWWFRVRWHNYRPVPDRFPRVVVEYSLNLWETDLALFEVVSAGEQEAAMKRNLESPSSSTSAPLRKLGSRWPGRRLGRYACIHPNQLCLFLSDDL
jgi:hypothetical protein